MDPTSLALLITTIVTAGLTFLLNIYQSVKSRHFESTCGIFSCFYASEHQEEEEK